MFSALTGMHSSELGMGIGTVFPKHGIRPAASKSIAEGIWLSALMKLQEGMPNAHNSYSVVPAAANTRSKSHKKEAISWMYPCVIKAGCCSKKAFTSDAVLSPPPSSRCISGTVTDVSEESSADEKSDSVS